MKNWLRHRPLCLCNNEIRGSQKMLEYDLGFLLSLKHIHVSIRWKIHLSPSISFVSLFIQFDMGNVDNVANNFPSIFAVEKLCQFV